MSPMPTLGPDGQALYDDLEPVAGQDAALGYPLAVLAGGLGIMLDPVDALVRDDPQGNPGWSALLDLDRCPDEDLPYLGQFIGVIVDQSLTPTQQRQQIGAVNNWARGSVAAMKAAPLPYLTGTQTVVFRERDPAACPTHPPYGLTVITYTSETPNSTAVLNALLAQKPAGIILNYQVHDGEDYESVYLDYATYALVYSSFLTYEGVLTNQPGT